MVNEGVDKLTRLRGLGFNLVKPVVGAGPHVQGGIYTGRVEGLGDLSHASVVFSRDGASAYVFGRDGGLTMVDLPGQRRDPAVRPGKATGTARPTGQP